MLQRIREQAGSAGLIVAIIALIAALGGGAYAATHAATASKAKPLTKAQVLALIKSHPGPAGVAGTNGTNGTNGKDGAPGEPGKNGESVTVTESANEIEGHCNGTTSGGKGGSRFVVGTNKAYACNGKDGETGFTETLPSEKTETGTWTFGKSKENVNVAISFPIPLAAPLGGGEVHLIDINGQEVIFNFVTEEEEEIGTPSECLGTTAAPTAEPGNLCIYTARKSLGALMGSNFIEPPSKEGAFEPPGADATGARLFAFVISSAEGWGTWAVTAP